MSQQNATSLDAPNDLCSSPIGSNERENTASFAPRVSIQSVETIITDMTFCKHPKHRAAEEAKRPSFNPFKEQAVPAEQVEVETPQSKAPLTSIPKATSEAKLPENAIKEERVNQELTEKEFYLLFSYWNSRKFSESHSQNLKANHQLKQESEEATFGAKAEKKLCFSDVISEWKKQERKQAKTVTPKFAASPLQVQSTSARELDACTPVSQTQPNLSANQLIIKWNHEEDEDLKAYVAQHGKEWQKVANAFGNKRLPVSYQTRYYLITSMLPANRGRWTEIEDRCLTKLFNAFGPKQFKFIANHFCDRDEKKCHTRWFDHLSPDVNRGPWAIAEDILLHKLTQQHGDQKALIATHFPDRSRTQIQNRLRTKAHHACVEAFVHQRSIKEPMSAQEPSQKKQRLTEDHALSKEAPEEARVSQTGAETVAEHFKDVQSEKGANSCPSQQLSCKKSINSMDNFSLASTQNSFSLSSASDRERKALLLYELAKKHIEEYESKHQVSSGLQYTPKKSLELDPLAESARANEKLNDGTKDKITPSDTLSLKTPETPRPSLESFDA